MDNFREYVQKHDSKRGHFMDYWRSLRNTDPIYMEPIAKDHRGTTKGEDTIRVSGSAKFIATIMGKLKDLILYDTDKTKLEVSYKQSVYTKQNGERSFILYVNAKER